MSSSSHLRRETNTAHRHLESTHFAMAIAKGKVERGRYIDYLGATALVLDTLCTQTLRHGTARERAVVARLPAWNELLAADLAELAPNNFTAHAGALANGGVLSNGAALAAALALADAIRKRVADGSAYLLGVAYVLVGSHRGNRSIAAGVAAALGLTDGAGTRYLCATRGEGSGPWLEFQALLERELCTPAALDEAVEGALATFATFTDIMRALDDDAAGVLHVSALNSEAGVHPIPQDPALIGLALEVSAQDAELFPYVHFRYGVRGQRFARSDTAWLLTLLELDMPTAERQIDWLAKLLATRGLPSLLLESRLQQLARALDSRHGDGRGLPLHQLARHVGRHRSSSYQAGQHRADLSACVPELGERFDVLLHCAVADQRSRIGDCADNIRAWASAEPRLSDDAKREIETFVDRCAKQLG